MIKTVTSEQIETMLETAAAAPRQRTHLCLHNTDDDPVQRLFVAGIHGTYFPPHRHPKIAETAIVVRGEFDILTFDDDGVVTARHRCSPERGALTFDIPANVWHCGIVVSETAVFFEAKPGPYDPQTISEFTTWAPAEGVAEVAAFQQRLSTAQVGDCVGTT